MAACLAVAVPVVLVLAAACGSGGGPHQGARSRSEPVARSASEALQPDASPGLAARQPTSVVPVSATFISPATGWLLAGRCVLGSRPRSCSVVMRKTTDGGHQWFPVPAPRAGPGGVPETYPDAVSTAPEVWPEWSGGVSGGPGSGVAQVRFADAANGWAFGPDLWVTHDGGATWRHLSTSSLMVTSLEAADGRAVAVFTGPGQQAKFQVYTSAVGSDAWQPVPGATGLDWGHSQDFDRDPQVAIEGSTAYVSSSGPYGNTSYTEGGVVLSGPADGSAPWQQLPVPCAWGEEFSMPVAAAPAEVVLGCQGPDDVSGSPKYVYRSADGGHTWATGPAPGSPYTGELPARGFLDDLAVTPAGTIVASGDREIYFSWDNGASWHTPAALAPTVSLDDPDQQPIVVLIGMTTSSQGFALPGPAAISLAHGTSWIWMTYDAGQTWIKVPLT